MLELGQTRTEVCETSGIPTGEPSQVGRGSESGGELDADMLMVTVARLLGRR